MPVVSLKFVILCLSIAKFLTSSSLHSLAIFTKPKLDWDLSQLLDSVGFSTERVLMYLCL